MARRTPGEGSITQRKDGRWQGALRLAGRRQTVYGKTRREVLGKLEALRGQAQTAGVLLERHTVGELCRAWHAAGTPRWAPTTTANYARYVQLIETGLGAQVPLGRLTPARLHALLLQHQRTPRTAQTLFYVLRAVLDLGVRWGWLAANPMERLPRPVVRTRPRTWWTPTQCQQFLAATRTHRWGPLWATALATRLRIGELLALRWEDIDPGLAGSAGRATTTTTTGGGPASHSIAAYTTTWTDASPFLNENGQVVGYLIHDPVGSWLQKRVTRAKHFYWKRRAWCADREHVERLRTLGAHGIRLIVLDQDSKVYSASLDLFDRFGFPVHFPGHGEQIGLHQDHWRETGPGAAQLDLFEALACAPSG